MCRDPAYGKLVEAQGVLVSKDTYKQYEYKQIDGNIVNINTETKFCSCRFF